MERRERKTMSRPVQVIESRIQAPVTDGGYASFLRNVAAAMRRVLMIDYDGTIAPFSNDRFRAFLDRKIPKLLDQIMTECRTRVILITGGPAGRIGPLPG